MSIEPDRISIGSPFPVLRAFMACRERVSICRGPLGSGKTTGSIQRILRQMVEQQPNAKGERPTRWVAIRNTYRELTETTIRDFMAVFQGFGTYRAGGQEPPRFEARFELTDGTRVVGDTTFLSLDGEDAARKMRGYQLTGVWLNETRELRKFNVDAADDRTSRFPSMLSSGVNPTWHGMLGDTNSVDTDHWLYRLAEEERPAGWAFFHQPGGVLDTGRRDGRGRVIWQTNPDAENLRSAKHPSAGLSEDYYTSRLGSHDDAYIRVFYANEYGFSADGKPVHPEYVDAVHCAKQVLEPDPQYPLVVGVDFGRCYDDQTEVLTEQGWKLFKDVQEKTDRVATLNPQTFELEYTGINFAVQFDHDGDMLTWAGPNLNFCVTPEHRVPYTRRDSPDTLRFASAEELSGQMSAHRYIQTATRGGWKGCVRALYPCGMSPSVFARFMGWWLSEGSLDRGKNRVSITQVKPHPELEVLLRQTGLSWNHYRNMYRVSDPELADYLRPQGLQPTRFVPEEILELPPELLREFVDAFTQGDGYVRPARRPGGSEEHTVFSTSKRLMDGFQEIAVKLGWGTGLRWQKGQTSTMRDGREIQSEGLWVCSFKKEWERVELHPGQFSRAPYCGKIYCLNVPYHTLCIRRGGKVSWNGNTPAAAIAQYWEHLGRWVVLDEFVTENMSAAIFGPELKRYLDLHYPGYAISAWGDPAGDSASQATEDTPIRILRASGIPVRPCESNRPSLRRAAIANPCRRLCIDGVPGFQVSPGKPKMIRKGLAGGFRFRRQQIAGDERYEDVPDKNEFSHPCEGLEYGMMGYCEGREALRPAARAPLRGRAAAPRFARNDMGGDYGFEPDPWMPS